eukprot:7282138-Prymnesium_polylepis.1
MAQYSHSMPSSPAPVIRASQGQESSHQQGSHSLPLSLTSSPTTATRSVLKHSAWGGDSLSVASSPRGSELVIASPRQGNAVAAASGAQPQEDMHSSTASAWVSWTSMSPKHGRRASLLGAHVPFDLSMSPLPRRRRAASVMSGGDMSSFPGSRPKSLSGKGFL